MVIGVTNWTEKLFISQKKSRRICGFSWV